MQTLAVGLAGAAALGGTVFFAWPEPERDLVACEQMLVMTGRFVEGGFTITVFEHRPCAVEPVVSVKPNPVLQRQVELEASR